MTARRSSSRCDARRTRARVARLLAGHAVRRARPEKGAESLRRNAHGAVALEGQKDDTSTHDVGFKIFPSFARGYELTGVDDLRQVALDGAASLATRYSPIVGAIRSWNGPSSSDFRVIIDNMMNLEILFWGASHGGANSWRAPMAASHALRTRAPTAAPTRW